MFWLVYPNTNNVCLILINKWDMVFTMIKQKRLLSLILGS